MFGDDFFGGDIGELFNQLAGVKRTSIRDRNNYSHSLIGTVELKKETILIFDLSGKKISSVKIEDDLEINEYGEQVHNGQKILSIRLSGEGVMKYTLPKVLLKRKMDYNFSNGILEVYFRK